MSIWEAFGMGRHKGFRGRQGCCWTKPWSLRAAWAVPGRIPGTCCLPCCVIDRGPAGRFLAGKNITSPPCRQLAEAAPTGPAAGQKGAGPGPAPGHGLCLIGHRTPTCLGAEPEHLLCAMLEDTDCAAGVLLASMGVQLAEAVRMPPARAVHPARHARASAMPRAAAPAISIATDPPRGGRRAGSGVLPDAELDRMVEILCRRQKNNPCLVGSRAWANGLPRPASASPAGTCPGCRRGGGCWRWIWPALWRAPSTGRLERFKTLLEEFGGTAAPSCLWTSSTPSWDGAAEGP